jgi:hypothetical protein
MDLDRLRHTARAGEGLAVVFMGLAVFSLIVGAFELWIAMMGMGAISTLLLIISPA